MTNGSQKQDSISFWVILLRFSGTVLVACVVLYFGYVFIKQYRVYREACRKRDALKDSILKKEIEIQELKNNIIRLDNDPAFAERIAREEGRVAPDESMVRTTNSLSLNITSPATGGN